MTHWPTMPDCGVYFVWPSEGTDWIHREDVELASRWIPSTRVFRRHSFDGEYYRLQYGGQSIRVKPTLWSRVEDEGFSVGDQVEVLSLLGENEACIGRIVEMRFDKSTQRTLFSIQSREMGLPRSFVAGDLSQLTKRPTLRPVSDFS